MDSKYLTTVKDDWLNTLDVKFQQLLEKLKEEKTKRKYKCKINNLKSQIELM